MTSFADAMRDELDSKIAELRRSNPDILRYSDSIRDTCREKIEIADIFNSNEATEDAVAFFFLLLERYDKLWAETVFPYLEDEIAKGHGLVDPADLNRAEFSTLDVCLKSVDPSYWEFTVQNDLNDKVVCIDFKGWQLIGGVYVD